MILPYQVSFRYVLEVWDPKLHTYFRVGRPFSDYEMASIAFHHPKRRGETRRVVKITEEVHLRAKGKK